jgi:hypothetical protein
MSAAVMAGGAGAAEGADVLPGVALEAVSVCAHVLGVTAVSARAVNRVIVNFMNVQSSPFVSTVLMLPAAVLSFVQVIYNQHN